MVVCVPSHAEGAPFRGARRAGMLRVPCSSKRQPRAFPGDHRSHRGSSRAPGPVRRLLEAEAPIALIVAPAGYGKSTLLAEWATRDERPFRSLPLTGLDAAGALLALAEATAGARATVIVVDDAHRAAPAAVRALLEGASLSPAGSTLAFVSRAWPARRPGAGASGGSSRWERQSR